MSSKTIQIIVYVLIVVIVSLIYKCNDDENLQSLNNNQVKTQGVVQRVSYSDGISGSLSIIYTFKVGQKRVEDDFVVLEYCEFYGKCAKIPGYRNETVGTLYCTVYYDSTDYTNSRIELDNSYCKE